MAGDTVRLTYTASRGLGEPIRLALVASGIDYTEIYLQTREDFVKLTEGGKLMFKQIPLLEIDGLNLIGSEAVLRYVCRKGNLEGKTDEEKVLSESKSGFFVGDSMTMADIMLFDALSCVNEIPELKAIGLLDEYPLCVAFIDHFSKQPRIVDYLASERRHTVIDLEQAAYASRLFGWLPS
eukprot:XP_001185610.2 PREDICTED: glutathione S-transferase 3 [Strongylocentrotus purpuratus]